MRHVHILRSENYYTFAVDKYLSNGSVGRGMCFE